MYSPEKERKIRDSRVRAISLALRQVDGSAQSWQPLVTAIFILCAREKKRLFINQTMVERLRKIAELCPGRVQTCVIVYTLFMHDDRGLEWSLACERVDLPRTNPDWTVYLNQAADAMEESIKAKSDGSMRMSLLEALRCFVSSK